MSRDVTAAFDAACQSAHVRPFLAAEIEDAGGVARYWTGLGDKTILGETFIGAGSMGSVSAVEEASDLYAAGLTFTLSGLPTETVAIALDDARQGLPARLYFGLLSDSGAIIADPVLVFEGLTDIPTIDDDGSTGSISISAENQLIRLETPNERRYTHEDQQLVDPGDLGFEFVPGLQDLVIVWGR